MIERTRWVATLGVALMMAAAACSEDDTDAVEPEALGGTPDASQEPSERSDGGQGGTETDASTTNDDAGDVEEDPLTRCTTNIQTQPTDTFVELCKPASGTVQHVRIAGVQATSGHTFAQVAFGFDAAPAAAQGPLAADQVRFVLYGGGPPPPPLVQAGFGTAIESIQSNATFVNAVSTVCFDLTDGSATTPPKLTLWVDGQKGASCSDRSTLTVASASASSSTWANGTVAKAKKMYFGLTANLPGPVVTISSVPAL